MVIFSIQGCSNLEDTTKAIRDPNMTIGCYVTGAHMGFDSYFNTTKGEIETCKLVCSKELPHNFTYQYVNDRLGCKVGITSND